MDTNWLALPISLLALWVAYMDYRRNNRVIIQVLEARYGEEASYEGHGFHSYFRVTLRNLGVPLYNLKMALSFTDEGGFSRVSTPMFTLDDHTEKAGQFAKGMTATFILRSTQVDAQWRDVLKSLKDPAGQNATLCLFADNYRAWDMPVRDRWRRLKWWWNCGADRLNLSNWLRRKVTTPWGEKGAKQLFTVCKFSLVTWELLMFVRTLDRHPPSRTTSATT